MTLNVCPLAYTSRGPELQTATPSLVSLRSTPASCMPGQARCIQASLQPQLPPALRRRHQLCLFSGFRVRRCEVMVTCSVAPTGPCRGSGDWPVLVSKRVQVSASPWQRTHFSCRPETMSCAASPGWKGHGSRALSTPQQGVRRVEGESFRVPTL